MKRNRSSSVFCSSIGFCLLSSCFMFHYYVPSNDIIVRILYTRCQFLKCARLINSSRKQFLIHWRKGFNPRFEYRMEECCTLVVLGRMFLISQLQLNVYKLQSPSSCRISIITEPFVILSLHSLTPILLIPLLYIRQRTARSVVYLNLSRMPMRT